MTKTIYFPEISAIAKVGTDFEPEGMARVCYSWNGESFRFGGVDLKYTSTMPKSWKFKPDLIWIHHIHGNKFVHKITGK